MNYKETEKIVLDNLNLIRGMSASEVLDEFKISRQYFKAVREVHNIRLPHKLSLDWDSIVEEFGYFYVRDMLIDVYFNSNSSIEAGEKINVSHVTILRKMEELDIPRRTPCCIKQPKRRNTLKDKIIKNKDIIKDLNAQAACERFGLSRSFFYTICRNYKIDFQRQVIPKSKFNWEKKAKELNYDTVEKMIAYYYYDCSMSLEQTGKNIGVKGGSVAYRMEQLDMPRRQKGYIIKSSDWEEWANLLGYNSVNDMVVSEYEKCGSLFECAESFGIDIPTLVNKMKNLNIERNKQGQNMIDLKERNFNKLKGMMDDYGHIDLSRRDIMREASISSQTFSSLKKDLNFTYINRVEY